MFLYESSIPTFCYLDLETLGKMVANLQYLLKICSNLEVLALNIEKLQFFKFLSLFKSSNSKMKPLQYFSAFKCCNLLKNHLPSTMCASH